MRIDADWCDPPAAENTPTPTPAGTPPITIADIALFAPAPSLLAGEPDNLGIAGLPTNFVSDARITTASATVLGTPITIRFTPSTYHFDYGDGDTHVTTTGGRTWTQLAQIQFTPTATTHVYRERGTYTARVDVHHTVDIDLGAGWFPLTGELVSPGTPQQIRIYEAHTALVARTCIEVPDAAGC